MEIKTVIGNVKVIRGDKGEQGVTFTPSVDENGNLSWTNDGGLENPPTVNIKGGGGGDSGSTVTPNPTLDGTETKLNGIEINGTKYAVGDIGAITLEASQMLSETQIQLTQAQADILKAFNFVYVNAPFAGLEQLLLKFLQNSEGAEFLTPTDINGDGEATNVSYEVEYSTNIVTIRNQSTTTIRANDTNATQELNTLRVGDTVYSIPSGLPTVTSADSGKFLTVNSSGQWVATTVPNAEESSF